MTEKFDLNREMNLENAIDAFGKKWHVMHIRGTALYEARPEPEVNGWKMPTQMEGRWTKPNLLKEKIDQYVLETWDMADKKSIKAERKEHVEKVNKKTASESLAELASEIKEALGDEIK